MSGESGPFRHAQLVLVEVTVACLPLFHPSLSQLLFAGVPAVGLNYLGSGLRQSCNEMTVLDLERQIPKSEDRKDYDVGNWREWPGWSIWVESDRCQDSRGSTGGAKHVEQAGSRTSKHPNTTNAEVRCQSWAIWGIVCESECSCG